MIAVVVAAVVEGLDAVAVVAVAVAVATIVTLCADVMIDDVSE